jgi:hypothetical protein
MRSMLEEDPEAVVAGVWGVVETLAECCIVGVWENACVLRMCKQHARL